MPTFKVTYPSGKDTYVETCGEETIEAFANRHFGLENYEDFGCKIEIIDGAIEAVDGATTTVSTSPVEEDEDEEEEEEE